MSRSLPLKLFILLIGLALNLIASPANDNFSTATVLTGLPVTQADSSAGATLEPSEPMPDGDPRGLSIWYRWTPATTGSVEINTIGSGYETILAVWTGNTLNGLTQLASNYRTELPGPGYGASRIFLDVTAGVTYHIAIYDFHVEGDGGAAVLNIKADTSSRINGRVTGSDGATALPHIHVTIYLKDEEDDYWDSLIYTYTDGNGDYSFRGLDAGNYRVGFLDPANEHSPKFFGNASDVEMATSIPVGHSQTVSGINASLLETSRITGTVTGPDGTTPLQRIRVTAYQWEDFWEGEQVGSTLSDVNGHYLIRGLEAGRYRIRFQDPDGNYLSEFYLDGPYLYSATPVNITGTPMTVGGINASLAIASHIKGKVTATDGTPLKQIIVEAYQVNEFTGS